MLKNIEINPEFKKALDLMENSYKNLFITGRAGTGKSTLLEYFRSKTEKDIVVLAPTGVAAVNISGQTIHSFFGFQPDITIEKARSLRENEKLLMEEAAGDLLEWLKEDPDEVYMIHEKSDLIEGMNLEYIKLDYAGISRLIYSVEFMDGCITYVKLEVSLMPFYNGFDTDCMP